MKELYEKSLRIIKLGKIKNVKQYKRLMYSFQLMSIESLKYISGENNFRKIVKLAQEF